MTDMRTAAVLALILATPLAVGCSKGGGDKTAANSPTAASPDAGSTSGGAAKDDATGPVITSDQLPVLKAGLWEDVGTRKDGTKDVHKICHSGKPFKAVNMGKSCSQLTMHRTLLGGFVMDATCGGNGMDMTMHLKATGDWNSHYAVDTTTTIKLPNQPAQTESDHREARWVGACPAGMEAED